MASRGKVVTPSVPAASRWRTAPGVPENWNEPHRDPEDPPGMTSQPADILGVGWQFSYRYGRPADHPFVTKGLRPPSPPGVLLFRDLDGDLEGWTVSVGFVLEEDEVRERIVVFYCNGRPSLVSRAQRELRVREAFNALRSIVEKMPKTFSAWSTLVEGPTGRRGTPLIRYALWAERRVLAETDPERGDSSVVEFMAEKYGYTAGSIKQWVFKARDKGLLTARDVRPPQLTPKAVELLGSEQRLTKGNDDGER